MRTMTAKMRKYLIESLEVLRQDLKDFGDCDHSVNVCACGLHRIIELGEALLKGDIQ